MEVYLNDIVCDTFHEVLEDIVNVHVGRLVLKGGRASTKSQTASEGIIIGCMVNRQSAVAMVKYGNKIKDRLVDTFTASINYLGVERWWKLRKSPFEYVLLDDAGRETDVSIKFTGCDNPDNLKSFKPRSGYFMYTWLEEATNFNGMAEVNNIIQTMVRGGNNMLILTYNPPQSTSSWVNKEFNCPCGVILGYDSNSYTEEIDLEINKVIYKIKQKVHHSTYLDVVASGHSDWLGLTWLAQAEQSKKYNPTYYRWAYLGEVVGTEANVFSNINDWTFGNMTGQIHRGLDCSNGGPDPWALGCWVYNRRENDLYCVDELHMIGTSTISDVGKNLKNKINFNPFYIDSAVPTFRSQLCSLGLNAVAVKKGKYNSVDGGIQWIRSMNHIYIDKIKTPHTYKEFKEYEYLINKYDEITTELPDKNNHHIDACRYAMSQNIIDLSAAR